MPTLPCVCLRWLQVSELLGSMTPDAVRLDLCTRQYEEAKAAVLAGMPGAVAGSEPWFNFPYVEAELPAEMRQRCVWVCAGRRGMLVASGQLPGRATDDCNGMYTFHLSPTGASLTCLPRLPHLPVRSWAAAAPSADITLPQRNEYLPTDFELCCDQQAGQDGAANGQAQAADANGSAAATPAAAAAAEPAAFPSPPTLLLDEPGLRVWHKLDASFRQPRTASYLRLFSAAGYASPRSAALSHLTIKLLEDALCQNAYMAEVAGLHYGIWWVRGWGLWWVKWAGLG